MNKTLQNYISNVWFSELLKLLSEVDWNPHQVVDCAKRLSVYS